jgi:hypothetical protein
MQPCNACLELVGKPSSAPPHGDLAESSVSEFGSAGTHDEDQQKLELHGLRKLAVPEHSGWRSSKRVDVG